MNFSRAGLSQGGTLGWFSRHLVNNGLLSAPGFVRWPRTVTDQIVDQLGHATWPVESNGFEQSNPSRFAWQQARPRCGEPHLADAG